jgi:tight adherence protein C
MLVFYLAILMCFPILGFLSRRETGSTAGEISAVQKPFEKMAEYLYRKLNRRQRSAAWHLFTGSSGVRMDLRILDASPGREQIEAAYFVRKIRYILLFSILAAGMALIIFLTQKDAGTAEKNRSIARNDFGESAEETRLAAYSGDEYLGEYDITVSPKIFSPEETETMAAEAFGKIAARLPGENPSLDQVSRSLDLPGKLDGYPFRISWKSSRYEIVDSSGEVKNESLQEGTQEKIIVTAVLSYEGRRYSRDFAVTVVPRALSESEKMQEDIRDALIEADRTEQSGDAVVLPDQVDGKNVEWFEIEADISRTVFLLILAAGLTNFFLTDRDLHRKVEKRKRQMQLDYPQVLSRLVLLIGAGMSVRSSFFRISEDYRKERAEGRGRRFIYEEILLMCHEMESGVSELESYSHFAGRCRNHSYSRFCSLLSQNLRKGNAALLNVLQQEAAEAFEERKNLARQMGEEAGTKLLFPMILMLTITMIMIMIPAYQSFSM